MIQTTFIPQGWECPKCQRVYSPTTSMCTQCPQHIQGVATTGTTLIVGSTATYMGHNFESVKGGKCKICGKRKSEHPNITYTNL